MGKPISRVGGAMKRLACCLVMMNAVFFLSVSVWAEEVDTYIIRSHEIEKGVVFHHRIFRTNRHRIVVQGIEHVLDNGTVIGRLRTIRFGNFMDSSPPAIYVGRPDYDSNIVDAQIRWIGKRLRELKEK